MLTHGVWTGVLYYGGFGGALVLLSWLRPLVRRLDPALAAHAAGVGACRGGSRAAPYSGPSAGPESKKDRQS